MQVLSSMLFEYALLGLGASAVAAVLGTLAGWILVAFVLEVGWSFAPGLVLLVMAGGVAATLVFGLAGSARALGAKSAPWLRNP
jgi:putative ABC transport system permease protein